MLSTARENRGIRHTVKIQYTDYGSCRFHAEVQNFRYKPPAAELPRLVKEEWRPNVFDLIWECQERIVEKDSNPSNWRRYVLELTNEDRKRDGQTCEAPQCNKMFNFRVQQFLQSRYACHSKAVRNRKKECQQAARLVTVVLEVNPRLPPTKQRRHIEGWLNEKHR